MNIEKPNLIPHSEFRIPNSPGIRGRIIVCVASAWDYDPTSKHQIMRILARDNAVLWVNYHGTRRPGINGRDLRSAAAKLTAAARGLRRVGPTLSQLTPLVVPGATSGLLGALHRRLVVWQIRRALARVRGSAPGCHADAGRRRHDDAGKLPVQVWSFAPDVPFLAGSLGEELFIYYCVDEFSKFAGVDARVITALEGRMMERADVVITTSEALLRSKRQRRPDACLVRHGVEFDHFAQAWRQDGPRPVDLPGVGAPILGFFGLIHHWVDVALLARVARMRPQYRFVLIGDCQVDVSALRALDNVHLLGRRPYAALPDYCRYFDAALLPFVNGDQTRDINPIKLREYLAAGLAVVSTPLPEAVRYQGPVHVARDAAEFARQCDAALTLTGQCGTGFQPASPCGTGFQPVSPCGTGFQPASPCGTGFQPVSPCGTGFQPVSRRTQRERIATVVACESWESVVGRLAGIVQHALQTRMEARTARTGVEAGHPMKRARRPVITAAGAEAAVRAAV